MDDNGSSVGSFWPEYASELRELLIQIRKQWPTHRDHTDSDAPDNPELLKRIDTVIEKGRRS